MESRPNAGLSVGFPGEASEGPGAPFAGFLDEPKQMPAGAVGKNGFLNLGFVQRNGRTILADLKSRIPYLAQRVLYCDENMPELAWLFVISTTGCVLQGDRLTLKIDLGAHARAHVTTQAATKVHAMDANYAQQIQTITVDEGGYLEYLPEPLIPHRKARYASHTKLTVAPTASLLYAEIVQSGRKHHHPDECFGATVLSFVTRARRPDGSNLFTENLLLEPGRQRMRQTGVMDGFDVFGNVILCTPLENANRIHQIIGADVDLAGGLAYGAGLLPNDAGVFFKVLGHETAPVKAKIRAFWQVARKEIVGADIPEPYLWR